MVGDSPAVPRNIIPVPQKMESGNVDYPDKFPQVFLNARPFRTILHAETKVGGEGSG